MHAVNISGKTFRRAMFPRSQFRSVFLPSHFVATFDFLLAQKKYTTFIQFPCSKFRPSCRSSIPLLQMCIGSYNFRIILVNDCCRRLPSVAHKTTNCIPLHLYTYLAFLFIVSFKYLSIFFDSFFYCECLSLSFYFFIINTSILNSIQYYIQHVQFILIITTK